MIDVGTAVQMFRMIPTYSMLCADEPLSGQSVQSFILFHVAMLYTVLLQHIIYAYSTFSFSRAINPKEFRYISAI